MQNNPSRSLIGYTIAALAALGVVAALLAVVYFLVTLSQLDRQGSYANTARPIDLNNDGRPDVLLHNLREETESTRWPWTTFWTNQPDGSFAVSNMEFKPVGYFSTDTGDLDGDGDDDFALLSFDLQIYLNQGGESIQFLSGGAVHPDGDVGTPGSLTLGDLDGDGDPDGFVAGCCGMQVDAAVNPAGFIQPISWVWLNRLDTPDSDEPQIIRLPALDGLPIHAAALGDLNGDGSLDVFAAVSAPKPFLQTGAGERVLFNDGAGNLRDSGQRLSSVGSNSVALGDLDSDGDLDALVGSLRGATVWVNTGDGVFQPGARLASGDARTVFLADFDNDGDTDALIAASASASLWKNNGRGGFDHTAGQIKFSERYGLTVADFNADGKTDIFAAAYEEDQRVWLNDGQGIFR